MINVPDSAWLVHSLLYWDAVGAIIPERVLKEPERLSESTRALLREKLLLNAFPASAHWGFVNAFTEYLSSLDPEELRRRQVLFQAGEAATLHQEKLLTAVLPTELVRLGLSDHPSHEWVRIEGTTAREWMAALVLGLCHPRSRWTADLRKQRQIDKWLPATDKPQSLDALLTGFDRAEPRDAQSRMVRLRVNGEVKLTQLRQMVLEDLLPIPDEPVPVEAIVKFRRKHESLLPQLRAYLEDRLTMAFAIPDEDIRIRAVDSIVDEAQSRIEQAKAYMAEAGIRRIKDSKLLTVMKVLPAVGDPIGKVQDISGALLTQPEFESEPLAYLAFASDAFAPGPGYFIDLADSRPLAQIVEETLADLPGYSGPEDEEEDLDDDWEEEEYT
jgi:hypothetical protein